MCSSPICSEEHLVFYHIFSQFFTNIFEFLNLKTENGEKSRNSISRLLAETENFPVFRRFSAGKFFPGPNRSQVQESPSSCYDSRRTRKREGMHGSKIQQLVTGTARALPPAERPGTPKRADTLSFFLSF